MDFTEHPQRQPAGSENDKFYSMMSPIQITESALNQFVNLTQDIDSKLYLNGSEGQSNKSSSKSRENKLFPTFFNSNSENRPHNKVPTGCTYYASLEKRNSYSSDGKQKSSPSKVSLLRNQLKLSSQGGQEPFGKNQAEQAKIQVKNSKIYNPSIENTQMSDKFALAPSSISVSTVKKSQSKDKKKKENKNFRIQKPDDIYAELEQQKKKSVEDQKGKFDKAKKIVDENITNKKNLLSENSKAVLNATTNKIIGKVEQNNISSNSQPQQLKNLQKFTATCLFRLPSSTLVPKQIIHSSDINNDFYHKYSFELTKTELIINSLYTIPFTHIIKVKIIYNEYNRPEIKITYSENPQMEVRASQSSSPLRDTKKELEEGQLVAYICQCYEIVYAAFSWIILYKVVGMMTGKFNHLVSNEAKSPTKKEGNPKLNLDMNFNYCVQGIIFKKSKYLKNWDRRYVKIENFVLKSYRSPPSSKQQKGKGKVAKQQDAGECTFELSNIKQLWTRFEMLEDRYLIVKIFRKNKLEKFEFAINLTNFCDFSGKDNWLFAFVGMLKGEV